ncbi:MAG: hypothetical protein K6G50_11070 [bacterium]|nr:hypothetical protein [bacterium]
MDIFAPCAKNITAVAGASKGSGKTAFLNYMLPSLRSFGPVSVLTIGSDVRGTKEASREIALEEGDVAVTTLPLLKNSSASFEILDIIPGRSSLGRLAAARARRPGTVQMIGSEHISDIKNAAETILNEGWAASAVVDGAGSRITQAAALGGVNFIYTMRITRTNLQQSAEKLKMLDKIRGLDIWPEGAEPDGTMRIWEGPLSSSHLKELDDVKELVIEDFTKIFLLPQEFAALAARCHIYMREPFQLLCASVFADNVTDAQMLQAFGKISVPLILNPYRCHPRK